MNSGNKKSGLFGLVAVIVAFFILKNLIPALAVLSVWVIRLAIVGFVILLAAIIISGIKSGSKEDPTVNSSSKNAEGEVRALSSEERQALNEANSVLVQIKTAAAKVRDDEIRRKTADISTVADNILKVLKKNPDAIHPTRRVMNYYLPTLKEIIDKYYKLEQSGTDLSDMPKKVKTHLDEIKGALDKQYNNLFDGTKLDLTVDMKALSVSFKRDGLVDEDFDPLKTLTDLTTPVVQAVAEAAEVVAETAEANVAAAQEILAKSEAEE